MYLLFFILFRVSNDIFRLEQVKSFTDEICMKFQARIYPGVGFMELGFDSEETLKRSRISMHRESGVLTALLVMLQHHLHGRKLLEEIAISEF